MVLCCQHGADIWGSALQVWGSGLCQQVALLNAEDGVDSEAMHLGRAVVLCSKQCCVMQAVP